MLQIYTVGHSSHSIQAFVTLLQRHGIEAIADVRSRPHSARFPHFSQNRLQVSLTEAGIRYVFLGRELGARREEAECYVNGQASYQRIASLPAFAQGIDRLLLGAREYRVSLMCAEHDPLNCHRTILVCHELKRHGVAIKHISRTGVLEDHEDVEHRLLEEELGRVDQGDLLASVGHCADRLEQAYAQRASRIAYRQKEPAGRQA